MKRAHLCLFAVAVAISVVVASAQSAVTVSSPNGALRIAVSVSDGVLVYDVKWKGQPVIERSTLSLEVDGFDLGHDVHVQRTERYQVDERYDWRGVHAKAENRANGARLITTAAGMPWIVDLRAQDDAVAFRFSVSSRGRHVPDSASTFRLPVGSIVWSTALGGHYESMYERRRVDEVRAAEWVGVPMTFKLPQSGGYASITEAGLRGYAGMVLQTDGNGIFRERLGHAAPANYPFTLRYGYEEAARLAKPAAVEGPLTTPWRVILVGDLNTLVNSDAVTNLSDPPDPQLFPKGVATDWVRPGRAVWRYLDGGENTPAGIKEFSRLAGELGFEYQVVEGQWARWSDEELRDVIDYSTARGVKLIVWRHRNTLGDRATRRELFARLATLGVAGLKVDFFDHEAKEVIDLYHDILRDAAEHKLLIDFHGSNKPAGESRTWPNEMTREGIYGLEHRGAPAWAAFNTTFPFTRMLAGHADYTPVVFGERRKETSWSHQIASAAILTSPILVYGGHPASFLSNPAADIIKSIPSVWDETRVLPSSDIGELALFARRSGARWFVAAMNGPTARTAKVNLSFLSEGRYEAVIARDKLDDAGAIEMQRSTVSPSDALELPMRAGGGFVARLDRR